jgi:hypothetical protein
VVMIVVVAGMARMLIVPVYGRAVKLIRMFTVIPIPTRARF